MVATNKNSPIWYQMVFDGSPIVNSDLSLNTPPRMGGVPPGWMKKRPLPDSFILQFPVPCSPSNNDYLKSVTCLSDPYRSDLQGDPKRL